MKYWRTVRTALILFTILFLLTGLVYPLLITGVAEMAFRHQAHGSLVRDETGIVVGSELIGQNFTGPFYFEGRQSSTLGSPYNAVRSGGSNLGPSNHALLDEVNTTIRHLETLGMYGPWPGDLVTSSASGLDPHITLDAAFLQVPVIAKARGMNEEEVRALVFENGESDLFALEKAYVNVLSLNRALDEVGTP
ncbi:MAG TPA: potassium-transporting ATPase subunit KdpC [Methanoregulaceae archaeon]|nr:potassium-transporting ATPase subunit KdpC [Methanoregulaceae archaeon]